MSDLFTLPDHVITFAKFWARWPNKVDRKNSERAWDKAMLAGVRPEAIMAGLDRYIDRKPAWQAWCHGATWLNQKRWQADYGPTRDQTIARELDAVFGGKGR